MGQKYVLSFVQKYIWYAFTFISIKFHYCIFFLIALYIDFLPLKLFYVNVVVFYLFYYIYS